MNPVHPRFFHLVARVALLALTLALAGNANAQASQPAPPLTIAPTPAAPAVVAVVAQEAPANVAPGPVVAAPADVPTPAPVPETFQALDTQVQDLKQDVLDLNRDLFMLEEELLFPANTQMAVFLSMDVSSFFQIDSVQLRLDDKQVANYLYTEREVDGLNRGGVQRLYLGNVKFGQHELVAFFTGKGPQDRDYRRGATITFRKGEGAKFLELRVSDRQRALQPEFVIKEWE
jgi:hypothetical protein